MCIRCLLAASIVVGLMLSSSKAAGAEGVPNKEKIDKLIKQMGSDTFAERELATKELEAIGVPALEALRKASKSDDAEVRKRAEVLLPKIEMQAESSRILAPKRIHLVYKDTPLSEAVADFQKKSGYTISLHDPGDNLKDRKVTLDTGETTFWHALALFCDKADLSEANWEDQMRNQMRMQAPAAPGGPPGAQPAVARPALRIAMPSKPGLNNQFILKDGKTRQLPTDDRGVARFRILAKSDQLGSVPEGEIVLPLDVSLEPKLQWQFLQSVHIDKALDDQNQKLAQVVPQVEGGGGINGGPPIKGLPPAAVRGVQMQQLMVGQRMIWGGLNQQISVQLKKPGKEAKLLKEIEGSLTAQVLTEPRPIITADNLEKAIGKSFKGDEGGSIKIVSVKSEEKETTIQLELDDPPNDKVVPAQPNFMPGNGVAIGVQRPGVKVPPAPPPAQAPKPPAAPAVQKPMIGGIGAGRPFGSSNNLVDCFHGLSVQDETGNPLLIDARRVRLQLIPVQRANAAPKRTMTCTLVCQHDKDKDKPTKVVYLGRKRVTVEVPFALKDVPLP